MARVRQERGYGTNPWSTHSRFLISHALLRNTEYAAPLRVWLEQGKAAGPAVEDQTPLESLLILDEAHNAAPTSNTLRYAIDSGLTRSLRDLAPLFAPDLSRRHTPQRPQQQLHGPARTARSRPLRAGRSLVIRQELGSLSPLVQRQVDEVLEGGIDTDDTDGLQDRLLAMDAADSDRGAMLNRAREELEAGRRLETLQQQQDELRRLLAKSHDWLGFAEAPFRSQGFLHHELSRACVLASRDPQAKLVMLGRLSLFGQGATRLHDALIGVIAHWHPGADRAAVLKPLTGAQRQHAWASLNEVMAAGDSEAIPVGIRSQLQAEAPADVAALGPALDEAARQARAAAADLLRQRGDGEAAALEQVLQAQRKRINATVRQRNRDLARLDRQAATAEPSELIPGLEAQLDVPALDLQTFSSQERRQLAADRKHWQRRLDAIKIELASEPGRIRQSWGRDLHRIRASHGSCLGSQ